MLGFDLLSNHFIEASAGTGKTYTIEHLVAKLIEEKGLKLDEILVVTFTRAATCELKERIRAQVESLDEEKIFTIHSFCFQTLVEHAFESGMSLDQIEECTSNALLVRVVKDYLRTCDLHPKQLEILLRRHQNDFDLFVSHLVAVAEKRIPIATTPLTPLPECDPAKLFEDLMAQAPLYAKMCNRQKEIKPDIIDGFKRLTEGDPYDSPVLMMTPKNRLKRGTEPTLHYPDLLPTLVAAVQSYADPKVLFARVAEAVRTQIEEVIEQQELIFFEDLIRSMEKNVHNPHFAEKVRAQYKAVLIDEFQDTDARQWTIFKTLFLGHVPLYLVGDPKQAIYRFRGADLYTYMEAKRDVGNVAILDTNFRSTPALVNALNRLFEQTTFALPRTGETLTYTPVLAGKEVESLMPPILLLKAESEEALFELVNQQIDPALETAVLVKDRFQAERFQKACRFPTLLTRGRPLHAHAYRLLRDLLRALLDPYDLNAHRLLPFLDGERIYHYHHLLEAKGLLSLFKQLTADHGDALVMMGGEELYLDLLQLVEELDGSGLPQESYIGRLEELAAQEEKARPQQKEGCISVMTIHASKGLEFDVVFPIGLALPKSRKEGLIYAFEEEKLTYPDSAYEQEIDAELVRQIYVSFTRAKQRLYIPLIEGKRSPIATFLEGHTLEEAEPRECCVSMRKESALIAPPSLTVDFPSAPIESFSSIAHYHAEKKVIEQEIPSGREVGTLLHTVLERTDFRNVDAQLIRRLMRQTVLEPHTAWVIEMVTNVAQMELPAGFALADVDPQKMIHELEFLYTTDAGYMRGFIDLFFEHAGSAYIIDWKSNLIVDSIAEEMERHQYALQANIYAEAVQKYTRLFGESTLGGIYYLFVREQEDGIYAVT